MYPNKISPSKYVPILHLYQAAALEVCMTTQPWTCCLQATRVAIDVLDAFGLTVTPQPVYCYVFNRSAWRWETSGSSSKRPDDAYTSGTDPSKCPEGAWPAYLIGIHEEAIIDGAMNQFGDDKKGLYVDDVSVFPFEQNDWPACIINSKGTVTFYIKAENSPSFEDLPGFQRTEASQALARRVLHTMKEIKERLII